MIAVIFTRAEGWDPGRVLEAQEGLEGHVAFIRRHRHDAALHR